MEELLDRAEQSHGHMCAGQVLGVRMAMLGCHSVGIDDPLGADKKKLLVFVEIDRCAADAINTVTGCRLGKRTLKHRDFGKLAATFLNTETDQAVRVVALEHSRELAKQLFGHLPTKKEQQMEAYKTLSEERLFSWRPVRVNLPEADRPGHPLARVMCDECGEGVNDHREVTLGGRTLCLACAGERYYEELS